MIKLDNAVVYLGGVVNRHFAPGHGHSEFESSLKWCWMELEELAD